MTSAFPEPSKRRQRVGLTSGSLGDLDGCSRALQRWGIETCIAGEGASGAPNAVDLQLLAPGLLVERPRQPWIALVDLESKEQLERAFELGAQALIPSDARPEEIAHRVRCVLSDLEHRRERIGELDLLDRLERATGVGSWEFDPLTRDLWLSNEARRILGLQGVETEELSEALRGRVVESDRARFTEWTAYLRPGTPAREIECRLAFERGCVAVRLCALPETDWQDEHAVHGVVEKLGDFQLAEAVRAGPAPRGGFVLDAREFVEQLARTLDDARERAERVGLFVVESDDLRTLSGSLTRSNLEHILSTIAQRVHGGVHESDTRKRASGAERGVVVGRTGNGLCIVVPGLTDAEDLAALGSRILGWIGRPVYAAGRELSLGGSLGMACSSTDQQDPEELMRQAESAAFCARRAGRDVVKLYSTSMDAEAFERLSLEAALRSGLARDEFVLHYQPRVEIHSGRIVSMEALVRWQHPDLGFVSPMRFIPVAEETGLIVPIGEHIMRTACRQARAWRDEGLGPIRMAVNLSPLQLHDPALSMRIQDVLRDTRLEADELELELTESALMRDPQAVVALLEHIKSLGVHLSIDDFGTGYSSLAYLRRFPVDALKIDRSFLRDATSRSDDAAIFSAIVLMGRSLKKTVVAEGVETPAQLSLLRVLRCDEAQGFLLSRPVPAAEASKLLRLGVIGRLAA